jgi:hypothetical protein
LDENERGRYFREIAAAFLQHRGAPFFLSGKDLALVSSWETSGLPLSVVLEGIESSFDASRPGARPRGKVVSLSYCEIPVARAWERHRDRKVGGARKAPEKRDRRAAVRKEIDRFLAAVPPGLEALRGTFLAARAALDKGGPSDEELERLDEKVEDTLRAGATAEAAVLLAKRRRAEFKVPYLSLFYY